MGEIEKPDIVFEKEFEVLNQRVLEYWTGTVEFEGQRFQRSGPSKKRVRDELCDKMIQVINEPGEGIHRSVPVKKKWGEKRETDQNACSTWVWDKAVPWVQMEELHKVK